MSYRRSSGPLAGALAVTLLAAGPARPETAPTNYELVREAARAASAQLLAGLGDRAGEAALGLRAVGSSPGNFLVENALSGVLTAAGHEVRTRPDSTGPVLEFEVVDIGLAYVSVHRHRLLGGRRVEREARARIFLRLLSEDRAGIVWSDQAESRLRDEVSAEQLQDLEEKTPPDYLKATLPARRWNKLVEPVVVTGILVGLIVLFFSNQDTSG